MSTNFFKTVLTATLLLATHVMADTCVTTIAGSGTQGYLDGPALTAQFNTPFSVSIDQSGNIIIADTYNNVIRKLDTNGTVSTIAGNGANDAQDGPSSSASFSHPQRTVIDPAGTIYISDSWNNKIRKLDINGTVTTFVGSGVSGSLDAIGTNATFSNPKGIAMDTLGNLYIINSSTSKIRKSTPSGIVTTIAGSGSYGYIDGVGTNTSFSMPEGIAIDSNNSVYVADTYNNVVRKITASGIVTTVAGSPTSNGLVDGPASSSKMYLPYDVAIDSTGTIYIADAGNNVIRALKNGVVTTIAGSGIAGKVDGPGSTAQFYGPSSIAVDAKGNIIVADTYTNTIRKITLKECGSGTNSAVSTSSSTPATSPTAPKAIDTTNNAYSGRIDLASVFASIWGVVAAALFF